MNTEDLLKKYLPLLKRHWLPISLGFLGLMFFAYGLIGFFGASSGNAGSNDITFESLSEEKVGENKFSQISVDVEGGVINPGVYKLNSDSRIQDALVAAGGISAVADRDWVAKNLNLALKLKDGMKIYIPNAIQNSKFKVQSYEGATGGNAGTLGDATTQININSAGMGELDGLAGVGPVTAQKIIDNRPYSTIEELLEKKVVSAKVFEQIRERITTY